MKRIAPERPQIDDDSKPDDHSGPTRRSLMQRPLALAASAITVPSLLAGFSDDAGAIGESVGLTIAPRYYPKARVRPQIVLSGKLAVITGASRGIGRAVGEALTALGVDVIGTSRNPTGVANPPAFPLLALDIADPASVLAFVGALRAHRRFAQHERVDILVNNAGRFVVGQIIPLPPTDILFYLAQRDLAMRTVYFGHVTVTNAVLPLMPQRGYARIMFTSSIAAYHTGAKLDGGSAFDAYNSGKAALRGYANNLDTALRAAGSSHTSLDGQSVPGQHAAGRASKPNLHATGQCQRVLGYGPDFQRWHSVLSSAPRQRAAAKHGRGGLCPAVADDGA